MKQSNFPYNLYRVYDFYRSGFQQMRVGKTLWKIIAIKLLIMFAVLKVFFFPNFLQKNFTSDKERADHVAEQFVNTALQDKKENNEKETEE